MYKRQLQTGFQVQNLEIVLGLAGDAAGDTPLACSAVGSPQVLNAHQIFNDAEARHKKGDPQLLTFMVGGCRQDTCMACQLAHTRPRQRPAEPGASMR